MKVDQDNLKTGLVLPGGGARGAFQVGVLKAIAELLPNRSASPFSIISGTSAGAINSVVLATQAERFSLAIEQLEDVWCNFHCSQVYRTDAATMVRSSLHWFAAIVFGGMFVAPPKSLLNISPLRSLLNSKVQFSRIQSAIDHDYLHAVAVTAAGYDSARSTTFFQSRSGISPWLRTRHAGVPSHINTDHLMASIAVPMIFPPVNISGEYFGDGAMRQATPLSPAIHLGADRILVIGVRNEVALTPPNPEDAKPFPSFSQIAGYMLDTLFMDGLYSDLENLTRINQLMDSVSTDHHGDIMGRMRPIDTMVVLPSKDFRDVAQTCFKNMPKTMRFLLRGLGSDGEKEDRLLSFLLFEQAYTRELVELGYNDAMQVKAQLVDFVTGQEVPRLFAPSWVEKDLSMFQ